MKGKNGVPDRWENYTNIGKVVEGTRFISFKVPLKQMYLRKLPPGVDPKWSLDDLVATEKNLGLVVDLTFTDRYYDYRELEKAGLEYLKIKTAGHMIPHKSVIKAFNEAVDDFLTKDETRLIGVHCTHGLNRTGYLICRYMIEKLGVEPDEAVNLFNVARGHTQERENYLKHLREKAWENEPEGDESPPEPKKEKKPRWRAEQRERRERQADFSGPEASRETGYSNQMSQLELQPGYGGNQWQPQPGYGGNQWQPQPGYGGNQWQLQTGYGGSLYGYHHFGGGSGFGAN